MAAILTVEEKRKGINILRVKNPALLDPGMADEMTRLLSNMLDSGAEKILIDIGDVTRMTSLFFRSFIIAGKKAKEKRAVLAFCNVSPTIKTGFEMMGLASYFTIYPDAAKGFDEMSSVKLS